MAEVFSNFASSTLAGAVGTGDTSFSVAAGDGTKFPNPTGAEFFHCVLVKKSTGEKEIVKVTARSTDTFSTVTRAQQGTSALALSAGDIVSNRPTKTFFESFATTTNIQDGSPVYAAAGGSGNAQTLTMTPTVAAYADGMALRFKPVAANTGAATMAVDGLTAIAIKKVRGGALVDLEADDLITTAPAIIVYLSGTPNIFLLLNPADGKKLDYQRFTVDGTYTKPTGLRFATFVVQGPGGGGAGAEGTTSQSGAGGGGGAGAFARARVAAASIGATEAITIGLKGAGGTAGKNNGSDGTASTSVGALIICGPGLGGNGGDSTAADRTDPGGAGGAVSGSVTPDVSMEGQAGDPGVVIDGAGADVVSGRGGNSPLGTGGKPEREEADGDAATGFGAGGSGACTTDGTNHAGGDGADGYVEVWEEF